MLNRFYRKFRNFMNYTLLSASLLVGCSGSDTSDPVSSGNSGGGSTPGVTTLGNQSKGKTDENGTITFLEPTKNQNVQIYVKDKLDQNLPLPGMDVVYVDGPNYEVFIVTDPNKQYLPSFNLYESNSSHTIYLSSSSNGYSKKTFSLSSLILSLESFVKNEIVKDQVECNPGSYIQTLTGDQYYDYLQVRNGLNIFLLTQAGAVEIANVIESFGNTGEKIGDVLGFDAEDYIRSHNWDMYVLVSNSSSNLITTTLYLDIESNPPSVSKPIANVNEDDVTFSWIGSDKTDYGTLTDIEDLTVCRGATSGPDLLYEPRILYASGGIYKTFTTSNSSLTENNIPVGNYLFEVAVFDEVGNGNVSNRTSFSITLTQQDTIVIQPDQYNGKDSYVEALFDNNDPNNPIDYYNNNLGNLEDMVVQRSSPGDNHYVTRSYIELPLQNLPPGIIESAILKVYGYSLSSNIINVGYITESWNENNITWANQPGHNEFAGPLIITSQSNRWYEFNITDFVSWWVNGTIPNYGLVLKLTYLDEHGSNVSDKFSLFYSSENTIQNLNARPKLEIVYGN